MAQCALHELRGHAVYRIACVSLSTAEATWCLFQVLLDTAAMPLRHIQALCEFSQQISLILLGCFVTLDV